jgi:hypothetical protein
MIGRGQMECTGTGIGTGTGTGTSTGTGTGTGTGTDFGLEDIPSSWLTHPYHL